MRILKSVRSGAEEPLMVIGEGEGVSCHKQKKGSTTELLQNSLD